MMNIDFKKNISKLIYLIIFTSFCFQTEVLVQDTQSYIDNIYKRPFFYPFLIDIFQIISKDNFLKYLSIFQIYFGFIAVIYFSFFFIKKYNIQNIFYQIILIFSIAYPYLGISMKLGLTILSESVGYPLFLFFSIFLIKNYIFLKQGKEKKYLLSLLLIFVILVLNKKTFMILVPLMIFLQIIDLIIGKNFKKFLYHVFFLIITLIASNLLEKTNTYFKSGVFENISVSGSSLLTAPFYLATESDLMSVKGESNKKIIEFAIKKFEETNMDRNLIDLSQGNILEFSKNNRKIFSNYFNQFVRMQDIFENKVARPEFFNLTEKDFLLARSLSSEHCTDIAVQLFKMKPKENLIFYLTNVGYGMGGYFISRDDLKGFYANIGFSGLHMLILQALIFLIAFISIVNQPKKNELSIIVLLFVSLNLANVSAIALYQPVYDRFSFFSFQIVFFITILVFAKLFYKTK